MASEKRCLYEVLGLQKDCTPDEIRSAYKKQALQRHPDKLVQSGLSQAEATAQFQELVHAYEVLSDPKERAWYDSHRSQILFSDLNSASNLGPDSVVPNLYTYFSNTAFSGYSDSGKGFYKVYSDLFNKIYSVEISYVKKLGLGLDILREAPIMGNLDSPYSQVMAFYNYWLGFNTVMDFFWVDEYDAMAGPNRKSRRVMEEENKKLRRKAKREYNETVRELAAFVKKRDKRVMDMMVKKNEEIERKRVEERERKKKLERERMERAKRYEEPEWARIDDEGECDVGIEDGLEEENEKKRSEFYCVVCAKKFKSEKQWKNHEQSKKHKEKVAELRESFVDEDEEMEDLEELDGEVEELGESFKDRVGIEERENESGVGGLSDDGDVEDEFFDVGDDVEVNEDDDRFVDEDEEISVLEAMVSGHKTRKKVAARKQKEVLKTEVQVENEIDEGEFMENDNFKNTRRKNKKERGKKSAGEAAKGDLDGFKCKDEEANGPDNSHKMEEPSSHAHAENEKENEIDEGEFMEYDNFKNTRRKNKKARGKKSAGEAAKGDLDGFKCKDEEANGLDNSHKMEEPSSHAHAENENGSIRDDQSEKDFKIPNQSVDGKGTKKDRKAKMKNSSKGNKSKATSKNSSNLCEQCGEEFESRNKLHKHLGDTGHASLKFR